MKYYLGIDIGASSGRHILGYIENGKIQYEEVHRFENRMVEEGEHLYWDIEHLFSEIVEGIKKCKEINKIPVSLSIDSFAVDYVLLDENDKPILPMFAYRDNRTMKRMKEVEAIIDDETLYAQSGIQKKNFNTMYQLFDDLKCGKLKRAKTMLMLPDYLQFLLTGKKTSEYTNATSSGLVDPKTKKWNYELIQTLGLPKDIFLPLQTPCTKVGNLKEEMKQIVGFDLEVIHCASHDTASAIVALPYSNGKNIYISSGTWSLMGVESDKENCSSLSQKYNFTNEGGIEYRYRYLKNIMGLWMIQCIRHEMKDQYSFSELASFAKENEHFKTIIDVNDDMFLAPKSMMEAIDIYCEKHQLVKPQNLGETCALIYHSLAHSYAMCTKELEEVQQMTYDNIYVIGGGSNVEMLNQLTASYTHKKVYAGISEATAIGNIAVQLLYDHVFTTLEEVRECIHTSFEVKEYEG